MLSGGALALAALWALAAVLLPLLVRGRAAALDLVMAGVWAAGLASCSQAIAESLGWAPQPRGLVASAVLAGALAVGARAWRGAGVTVAAATRGVRAAPAPGLSRPPVGI